MMQLDMMSSKPPVVELTLLFERPLVDCEWEN